MFYYSMKSSTTLKKILLREQMDFIKILSKEYDKTVFYILY